MAGGQPGRIPNLWDSSSLGLDGQTIFAIGSDRSCELFERCRRAVIQLDTIDLDRQISVAYTWYLMYTYGIFLGRCIMCIVSGQVLRCSTVCTTGAQAAPAVTRGESYLILARSSPPRMQRDQRLTGRRAIHAVAFRHLVEKHRIH